MSHKPTSKLHVMLADLMAKTHDEEQAMEHYRICESCMSTLATSFLSDNSPNRAATGGNWHLLE